MSQLQIKSKKAYLQISFAWIFAILVGVAILFIAIVFASKLITTEEASQDAQTGKEIGILLNPLETSFETGKTNLLNMPVETRIYNKCDDYGNFGRQLIKISQKSLGEWTETDVQVEFLNRYIFSEEYEEGKLFYLFSKPFEFPFKVSDLIYLTSSEDKYCFVDAPDNIKTELKLLDQKNINISNCENSEDFIKVCFGGRFCDINVKYNTNQVIKEGNTIYFEGDALMYAAIFSDKEIYECQLNRLMERTKSLALLYNDKENFVARAECNAELDLLLLVNAINSFSNSANLGSIKKISNEIQEKNDIADCKLW